MAEKDGTVVGVNFRGPERGAVEYREKEQRTCYTHRSFELDEDSRRVYCQDCREEVDPFTALASFAADWRRWRTDREQLQKANAEARERLRDLKRLESNTRARIRRKTGMSAHEQDRAVRELPRG